MKLLKIKNIIKNNYHCIIFFIFSLFVVFFLLYNELSFDATWEYGMSHAIRNGLLPYKDINTVAPPFFIYLFSTGLFIKDSFLTFLIEFCIVYTIMYYFLKKILNKNAILIILSTGLLLFYSFIPTYNALCVALIVVLMYMEKEEKSDKLIGVISGLLILTKHTIGIPILFIAFLGVRNIEKIKKRLIGLSIPLLIFIIYLLVTNTYKEFFDMCILGLFDFGTKNKLTGSFYCCMSLILIISNIYYILKDKDNVLLFYSLGAIFFVIPICDLSHFAHYFVLYLIPIVDKYNHKMNLRYIPYVALSLSIALNIIPRIDYYKNAVYNLDPHFEYTLTHKKSVNYINEVRNKIKGYDNYIIVDNKGMYFDIIMDHDINYFSIPLYGNHGYNGTEKMIKRVKKMHDYYFLIDYDFYMKIKNKELLNEQLNIELIDYIIDNSNLEDRAGTFNIYYKK